MVGGIYVLEVLIAPPRAGSAVCAVGATGKSPEQSETSGVPGGAPAEGEWRAVQHKGAAVRVFTQQGPR
eukprot:5159603-Alexandrium_andersonii.AAC.1